MNRYSTWDEAWAVHQVRYERLISTGAIAPESETAKLMRAQIARLRWHAKAEAELGA